MNKKRDYYLLKIILSVFACFIVLSVFPGAAQAAEKKIDAVSYKMKLTLDTKKDHLKETVTIKVKNNTAKTVSTLCLRDMTPAIHKYNKKYMSNENKNKSSKIGYVRLKGKKKNLKIKYGKDKTVLYVKLGKKGRIKPGESASVVVSMETDVPNRQDRFGVMKSKSGKIYCLSFCFPYLADNVNGKWITDPFFDDGENRSYDIADYYVTLSAPASYKVAATGNNSTKGCRTVI